MSGLALVLAGMGQALFGTAPPVEDGILARERGGFMLPNGVDVALTVQTQTAVDGAVVLRTVFQASQGAPTLAVYAPRAGETVASDAKTVPVGAATAATPVVTYDRTTGIQVTTRVNAPTLAVGGAVSGALPAGLEKIAGGVTDNGTVTQAIQGGVRTVELRGADLTVTHIAGNAFGSAIANAGSDRTIDTQTSLSIDLGNAGPDVVGSSMLRVADVASAAAAMRAQ